jgi:type IV pili sensor histidine kinase/response regulator
MQKVILNNNARFIFSAVKTSLLAIGLCGLCSHALADANNMPIGRYLSVGNRPQASQLDLLAQIIQVRFPQNVQTIGGAMNYILRLSGYSLTPFDQLTNVFKTTLGKPLPAVDRNFGPMSLKDALITLAGPAFYLEQDPLNRTVAFRVKPQYERFNGDGAQS